jgi:hypothetical protein
VVYGPHPEKPKLPSVDKKKQSSITPTEFKLPVYNTGQRCGPGLVRTANIQNRDAMQKAFK